MFVGEHFTHDKLKWPAWEFLFPPYPLFTSEMEKGKHSDFSCQFEWQERLPSKVLCKLIPSVKHASKLSELRVL